MSMALSFLIVSTTYSCITPYTPLLPSSKNVPFSGYYLVARISLSLPRSFGLGSCQSIGHHSKRNYSMGLNRYHHYRSHAFISPVWSQTTPSLQKTRKKQNTHKTDNNGQHLCRIFLVAYAVHNQYYWTAGLSRSSIKQRHPNDTQASSFFNQQHDRKLTT